MSNPLANYYFDLFIKSGENEIKNLTEYTLINEYLKLNDWLFISPIFFQGFELETFLRLSKTEGNNKEKILEVITKKFYDLRCTASFIEGYCNRCDFIEPFLKSIENSLILTFQMDYEGSIKTIIPIIEGILRKYLIAQKSFTTETIRPKDLKESFNLLKLDLITNYKNGLKTSINENGNSIDFSGCQIEELAKNREQYYNIWFSFVDDFIINSFYLNTRGQNLTNEINRHSILHEFGLKFEYNFENYIKIYFLLQFLTWVFLQKEKKSTLNNIESYRFFEKITAYERIIKYSEKLLYEKHILLKNYDNYDIKILKKKFPEFKNDILPKRHLIIYKLLRKFDQILWKRNIKKSSR